MKLEFLKKLNAKVIAIAAAAAVFVIGGGTAIALAAASPAPENPELSEQEAKAAVFPTRGSANRTSFPFGLTRAWKMVPRFMRSILQPRKKAMITTS